MAKLWFENTIGIFSLKKLMKNGNVIVGITIKPICPAAICSKSSFVGDKRLFNTFIPAGYRTLNNQIEIQAIKTDFLNPLAKREEKDLQDAQWCLDDREQWANFVDTSILKTWCLSFNIGTLCHQTHSSLSCPRYPDRAGRVNIHQHLGLSDLSKTQSLSASVVQSL